MANRIPEVSPVLDEAGLPLHGFCRFEEIRPYLLSCRAASRIDSSCSFILNPSFQTKIRLAQLLCSLILMGASNGTTKSLRPCE